MLAAPVLPLPQGTPPPQHEPENGIISVVNVSSDDNSISNPELFQYKARECKSAPAPPTRTLEDFGESDCEGTSSSNSSSSNASVNSKKSSFRSIFRKRDGNVHRKFCCHCSLSLFADFFIGNACSFTTWSTSYASTSRLKYLSLFFIEASLRSIGDVVFCSNPFSGLVIFIAMLISCPLVAFLGFLTLTMGIETAVVFLHIPLEEIRCGAVTFNNFLTGTVIGLIAQHDVILVQPEIIGVCLAVGILTVIVWKGLNGSLAARYEFPLLNAPFHVMILLYIYTGLSSRFVRKVALGSHTDSIIEAQGIHSLFDESSSLGNASINRMFHTTTISPTFKPLEMDPSERFVEPLNWEKVFSGIILAHSQIFGTSSLCTSTLVHVGMLLYSPIMLLESITGSAIGTLIGIALTYPEDYETLYNGSWGYNPLLTTAAIGGFLVVFNFHSWLLSIAGGILTALVYAAMVKCHVPPLGIPFMLITWLVLPSIPIHANYSPGVAKESPTKDSVQVVKDDIEQAFTKEDRRCNDKQALNEEKHENPYFVRVKLSDITYPENHRRKFLNSKGTPILKEVFIKRKTSTTFIEKGKFMSTRRESKLGISKGGVQNKYKSSVPEVPPHNEEMPPELVTGVEEHSILPL